MSQFKDAVGNFVDTPPGNVHLSSSLNPVTPPRSNAPLGTAVKALQVTSAGVGYLAVVSNPA